MEFLLDQGLPRSTVQHLQALGLEAEHVGALGLATASDEAIIAEGIQRGAIVVTLDADFHAILARSGAAQPSVIRIRIQAFKGEDVARVINQVVQAVEPDLLAGAAVTVTERRLALRRLPLISKHDTGPVRDESDGTGRKKSRQNSLLPQTEQSLIVGTGQALEYGCLPVTELPLHSSGNFRLGLGQIMLFGRILMKVE
jgi:predicted nuclease of predicted toxin-antitoxin system